MVAPVRRRGDNRAFKLLALLAATIFLQTTFGSDLRVHGVAPDFMLLLAVSAGFAAGPDEGALIGFACGLLNDLFLQNTPFGLSALAYCLAGFGVGWAKNSLLRQRYAFAPFVAAAGTVTGVCLFVVIGYVVGAQQLVLPGKRWLVETAFVEAVFAAVFSIPALVLTAWALRGPAVTTATLATTSQTSIIEAPVRRHPLAPRSRRRHRPRARVR